MDPGGPEERLRRGEETWIWKPRTRILEASGVEIQWETHYAGAQALEKFGETLPQDLLDSIRDTAQAIDEIDSVCRKQFREAYEAINAGFQGVFVHLFGAAGISNEYPINRYVRDAKVVQVIEGTNQIQRNIIANAILGRESRR